MAEQIFPTSFWEQNASLMFPKKKWGDQQNSKIIVPHCLGNKLQVYCFLIKHKGAQQNIKIKFVPFCFENTMKVKWSLIKEMGEKLTTQILSLKNKMKAKVPLIEEKKKSQQDKFCP